MSFVELLLLSAKATVGDKAIEAEVNKNFRLVVKVFMIFLYELLITEPSLFIQNQMFRTEEKPTMLEYDIVLLKFFKVIKTW